MEQASKARWIGGVALVVMLIPPGLTAATGAEPREDQQRRDSGDAGWTFGAGIRVGGYGFREVSDESVIWDDCRMNGVGLFGTVDFTDTLFAELSVDVYHATGTTVSQGMERLSVHTQAAAGARLFPDFIVSPYLQLGVGPEWTKGRIGSRRFERLWVTPFFGFGGEVAISRMRLGANLRSYLMGVPRHGGGQTHGSHHDAGGSSDVMTYEAAAQVQFSARYVF